VHCEATHFAVAATSKTRTVQPILLSLVAAMANQLTLGYTWFR